jgi:hypothetical protein
MSIMNAATAVIAVMAIATVGLFFAIVAAAALVTRAVRTEERRRTLFEPAPGAGTWLARNIVIRRGLPVGLAARPQLRQVPVLSPPGTTSPAPTSLSKHALAGEDDGAAVATGTAPLAGSRAA